MHNSPLLIVGPSGSGKTFIADFLVKNYPFKLVLSSMTREPRKGEKNLVDNEFLSFEDFEKVEESGDFFMVSEFFGNKYGYRRSFVENIIKDKKIPVAIVFAPVLKNFLKEYPNCHVIFLKLADLEFLRKRLEKRGEDEETIEKRLKSANQEIAEMEQNCDLYSKIYEINSDQDAFGIIEEVLGIYGIEKSLPT